PPLPPPPAAAHPHAGPPSPPDPPADPGKLHTRKKPARFLDRKLADIRDGFPRDPHGSRFGAQTRAAALGTAGVAAVAAQKHTHMQLIFLALQPLEKPLHPLRSEERRVGKECRPRGALSLWQRRLYARA